MVVDRIMSYPVVSCHVVSCRRVQVAAAVAQTQAKQQELQEVFEALKKQGGVPFGKVTAALHLLHSCDSTGLLSMREWHSRQSRTTDRTWFVVCLVCLCTSLLLCVVVRLIYV